MGENASSTLCGLPDWVAPVKSNSTVFYVNSVVVAAVNMPFCVTAFLGNLAVIVAVIKTPSLQRPCNILLCSLAVTDCLTGLTAQPIFVAWCLVIGRIHKSCVHQAELFEIHWVLLKFVTGWSFLNQIVISCDRHYAVSKPLIYQTTVTKKVAMRTAFITGLSWSLFAVILHFILPTLVGYALQLILGVAFVVIPIINNIGVFFAVRRHNNALGDAVASQQLSVILRREKKAALDMIIIITILLLCLAPGIVVNVMETLWYFTAFDYLYSWGLTFVFLNSSINPVIYLVRNNVLRNAVRSMMHI